MSVKRFHLISLGCAKNTVDSESMAQLLLRKSFKPTDNPKDADFIIVNTCGFINPAKDESYQVLRDLADGKRQNQLLIAAGCLTQRYGTDVIKKVPSIDGVLGTRRWMDILDVVESLQRRKYPEPLYHLPYAPTVGKDERGVHRFSVQGKSAYLKIADGCRRPCAFCAIPLIKGTLVSRSLASIRDEARTLQEMGIREIILISQDTTDYGRDMGVKNGLVSLLKELVNEIPYVDWIRVMYTYPGSITDELGDLMAAHPQILPYLDMPLQHAHPEMLKRMHRPSNLDWVYATVEKMREKNPGLAIRTTFIVGYPGETESEFNFLLDFMKAIRFDRVGAFKYSFETGTAAESLGDPISSKEKQNRWEQLMELQQGISLKRNQSFVGDTLDVLIEGQGDGISIGRSYRDAPEIDGLVIIEDTLAGGEIYPVRITGAMVYDLNGLIEKH